ncbi:hypothetical protein HPB52_015857 [Rhipicephalus sanguineus]|uniref:Uncharacterized protein n=1 Tax=Rhipicephalus sanguineus TaxID=34632 RepID=A0A9D4TAQ1_RHISA|nr:hypothetical protein HPB52_015857 [Rhipicephalus sanguineus]
MAKKQDEPRQDAPKAGRAKRRAVAPAAADDAGGPCNEAPAAKRPHGRLRNTTLKDTEQVRNETGKAHLKTLLRVLLRTA